MKRAKQFQSYPGGASIAGGLPAHVAPIVAVPVDWTLSYGNRAQRRRIERAMRRQRK